MSEVLSIPKPSIEPAKGWIEVDHASDDVSADPVINPEVFEFFELVVDPADEWNKWLIPLDGVGIYDESYVDDPDADSTFGFRERTRFLAPNGEEGHVVYEDASVSPIGKIDIFGHHRVVRLEVGPQFALPVGLIADIVRPSFSAQ